MKYILDRVAAYQIGLEMRTANRLAHNEARLSKQVCDSFSQRLSGLLLFATGSTLSFRLRQLVSRVERRPNLATRRNSSLQKVAEEDNVLSPGSESERSPSTTPANPTFADLADIKSPRGEGELAEKAKGKRRSSLLGRRIIQEDQELSTETGSASEWEDEDPKTKHRGEKLALNVCSGALNADPFVPLTSTRLCP
eukprot:416132-Prorocentrum_minimum.AAC.5